MDTIIYLGGSIINTKEGKTLYKVSFAAKVDDSIGEKVEGYEADTCLVSKDMYNKISACSPMEEVNGIVVRDNYRLKIYRLL